MVVNNFDILRTSVFPNKANTPLIVDPDAVLACAIAPQEFEPIAGRHLQI
jgi:hypothetical protein|tara:strand:+ start:4628 stop:4777 length:150 start_codon:yes stop_codon:yes gene_type:complete